MCVKQYVGDASEIAQYVALVENAREVLVW
jgi:hypothetical protein